MAKPDPDFDNAFSRDRLSRKVAGDERPEWERPQLKRLQLSLDTAFTVGSGTDAGLATTIN